MSLAGIVHGTNNLGRVVYAVSCPWGEMSLGRVVHGASCPWGELSIGRVVNWASCPCGELSVGQVVHGASCLWGELSMGRNDCGVKCHRASFNGASCSWDEFQRGKLSGNPSPHCQDHTGLLGRKHGRILDSSGFAAIFARSEPVRLLYLEAVA